MAAERDFELLDDYLSNRLRGDEKSAFEETLKTDSELKNELKLQQKLIEGIRNARTVELKSMLSNIPIPPPTGETTLLTKAAGWVAVTGLVATGLYFLLKNDEPVQTVQPSGVTLEQKKDVPSETQPLPTEEKSVIEEDKSVIEEDKPSIEKEKKTSKPSSTTKKVLPIETSTKVEQPTLNVYDPTKELESNKPNLEPKIDVNGKTLVHSSIVVETDNTNKKYTFHYQFKEGKLLLYGLFEKNLYEIMEFFSNEKRTIFLFYKSNYYLLDESGDKIKALSPINDPVLLNKLKEYRGH